MKGKKWLVLPVSLAIVLLANSVGGTMASFVDLESSTGNTFQAWASRQWLQTTEGDFNAGVLNNVDTSSSPGDVMLDATSNNVTDTFNDETMIASKSNLVVAGGQVKLTSGTPGTETLRPNASGTYTQCARVGDSANYRCVDDVTPDGDTTYVYPGTAGERRDTYATEDSSVGTGTINSVTLYFRARLAGSCPTHTANTQLLTHGTLYAGTSVTLTGSYADYSTVYTTNPNTGSAWTWTEVNDMEIGIGITGCSPGNEPFVTQVWAVVDYSGAYNSPGILTSINLLSGETITSIDSFGYTASAIPSGTGLKVQFSQDNTNWYNSAGTAGGWDTLSQGTDTIDLSGLGWSGPNFYYKMEFTSDGTDTPVLDEISVNYASYSGTIASQVLDTGIAGDRWDALFWDETLPSGSNGTETLRPNASGTYTQCARVGDSANYRCVDDVTPDGDATYVYPGVGGLRRDTYATEDSSVGTGTINSVTLYFRARLAGSCPTHTANTQLITHSTLYAGTSVTLTGSYADYSTVYTTNPNTGSAWTWTEVNDMEIGIGITGCSPGNDPFVTQVWAVVDYSGGAPSTDITFEVRASDTLSGGFPDTAWIPVGGTSPVTSGLPSGRYMQWRATLTTSDPSATPVLHEVRVYYY